VCDADPKFFACLVRFESSSVPTTLPTAYDVYPLDGRHDGVYYTVKDCVTIDFLPGMAGSFFFQAEDVIRDYKVTGVQTCALPIWRSRGPAPGRPPSRRPTARPRRSPPRARRPPTRGPTASRPVTRWPTAKPPRPPRTASPKIGRASCRERGKISGVGVLFNTDDSK